MIVSLIAAMAKNRVIGIENRLPWDLPEDLAYFRRITAGKPVIMGRKTYESIGHPLPGRLNLVISSQPSFRSEGVLSVGSLDEALRACKAKNSSMEEIFVIGGQQIYEQALKQADRIYITVIERNFEGDTYFPVWNEREWVKVSHKDSEHISQLGGGLPSSLRYSFQIWERQK